MGANVELYEWNVTNTHYLLLSNMSVSLEVKAELDRYF